MTKRLAQFPFDPSRLPFFYGWPVLVVGALGVLMSVPGQTIGVSVFTDPLISALDLTRSQLSTAYMFGTVGSACLLPFAGKLYDRFGARVGAVTASLCLALVLVVLSHSDAISRTLAHRFGVGSTVAGFAVLLPGFFALRFWGQGVLTLSSHNMIAKWFDRRRGLASGVSGLCVALGFSSAPLALDSLIQRLGWRGAWLALAAVLGGGFALLALVMYRDNPEDCGLHPDGVDPGPVPGSSSAAKGTPIVQVAWTREQAVRTWSFWVFSLSFALFGLYSTGLTFHVVSIFATAGMTRSQAIGTFLPISVIAVGVHLTAGWLSDRMALKWLLATMLAALILSALGLAFLGPGLPWGMVVVGNGAAAGLSGLLSAVTWARFYGRRHLGAISGVHMSVAVLCSALGPVIFSQALSWTGSYRAASLVCLAASGLLLVSSLYIARPVPVFAPADQEGEGRSPTA
jgi:MFS family permease